MAMLGLLDPASLLGGNGGCWRRSLSLKVVAGSAVARDWKQKRSASRAAAWLHLQQR